MEGKKTNKNTKMKNFKHGQNFGGNTNVNRVSFVGWWLVVGGWWLEVGGWWLVVGGWLVVGCVFFCTLRFPS